MENYKKLTFYGNKCQTNEKEDYMARGKSKQPKVSPEFIEEVEGLSVEALQARIIDFYKEMEDLLQAKAEDPDLARLKEALKEANASYSTRIKELKNRISFILAAIDSRGKA